MNSFYLCLVGFLFVLAIFDLMVGVSNDAVNFLNSAIGAKVATFRTIIIVAGCGIFLGASMSSGMMDIARNGMFHPEMFSFKHLMIIFVAVTASDIVLMNIFNSLGMPTSTTVSMVFELLGGTFAISLIKKFQDPSLSIGSLVNSDKALSVIAAIFISVAVAFLFGILIQYISRLFFTFAYKNKNLKWKIGPFAGIAGTAILYFLLLKGVGGSPYVQGPWLDWVNANTGLVLLGTFLFMTVLMQVLYALKVNVFKVLVLMGTFSLAMAFAGNDLCNFIGVCLAGFSSFQDFSANGTDPATYMMDSLNGPSDTSPLFLIASGVVMVIALATSKKAQRVIKTSVDLARQDAAGDEMFGSSKIARVLVRACTQASASIGAAVPQRVRTWVESRFNSEEAQIEKGAAFDEIRATLNLVVASLLIALGTSMKLPLSTTYVSFMVAMGSSLADRAWGRESAVFRITGVLSVIGGWFITAGAAFTLCFCVAMIMFFGGQVGTIAMACLAIFIILKDHFKKEAEEDNDTDKVYKELMASTDPIETNRLLDLHVIGTQSAFLEFVNDTYRRITDGFINENLGMFGKAENAMRVQRAVLKQTRRREITALRRLGPALAIEKNTWFHTAHNACEEILFCLKRIADPCQEHIDNNFVPLDQERIKEFVPLRDSVIYMYDRVRNIIASGSYSEAAVVKEQCDQLAELIASARHDEMVRMQMTTENIAVAYVYLSMLQESQQLIISLRHLLRASRHFHLDQADLSASHLSLEPSDKMY